MMHCRIRVVILITIILGSGLSIVSHAQEDSYKIKKLVMFRDDKAESIMRDSGSLVEIRDSKGRDRTPEEGVKEGDEIALGRYVRCGSLIGAALQANNNEVFWMNSNTSVHIKDEYIKADEGEIFIRAKGLKLGLINGDAIDPEGSELYLKAGNGENLLYLLKGRIRLQSHILDKQKPFVRISQEGIESLNSDRLPGDFEEQAKAWRKSIRSVTSPFWRKPRFYGTTAAAIVVAGIGTAAYYFTRPPEVNIHVEVLQ